MGFNEAKRLLIKSLEKMKFAIYWDRPKITEKNKLYSREVNVDFVLNIIENCNEEENYFSEDSWDADDNKSHIFINKGWYIKFILLKGIVNIISVHKDRKYV